MNACSTCAALAGLGWELDLYHQPRRCSKTLFGSLQVERLHGQRFETRRRARDEAIAWLLWCNRARLHSKLAYVSPMQFEQTQGAADLFAWMRGA